MVACAACGWGCFEQRRVLWPALIRAWDLSPDESAYVDRRQGLTCLGCGCNLRAMALAAAVRLALAELLGETRTPLRVERSLRAALRRWESAVSLRGVRVLEINRAGQLTPLLAQIPGHRRVEWPAADMRALSEADGAFDLVVHSDTLEHVPDPVAGLRECWRVLGARGLLVFTVPIVVGRLTRSRDGLPDAHHDPRVPPDPGLRVATEYGADAWTHVLRAGFAECRIVGLEYPAGLAMLAAK
jgi:SAM-dependent methyltransferase